MQAQVVGREFVEGWVKYRIQIESVFKRSKGLLRIRRGAQAFWLPNSHVVCKCPKVKIGRRYLMMGNLALIVRVEVTLLFQDVAIPTMLLGRASSSTDTP